ncbi:MAG: DUF3015 domain-containing protein [bacterium]|nr:DUF3015 domain-containing protein [bacterium]
MMMIRGIRGTLLGAVLGLGLLAAPALADNDVGCGLGTQFMEGKEGLVPHLMASCTNGMTLQSVSLTLNMFGCDATGTVTADAELRKFAASNIDQLARDVARGDGEALAAFAHLLQVPSAQQAAFGAFTQGHFVELFPNASVDSNEMIDAFYRLLDEHAAQG